MKTIEELSNSVDKYSNDKKVAEKELEEANKQVIAAENDKKEFE